MIVTTADSTTGTNSTGTLTITNGLIESGNVLNRFDLSNDPAGTTNANDQLVINGEPCAQIYATPGYSGLNPHPVELRYASALRRWLIENIDAATLPAGQDFYVVVDEAALTNAAAPPGKIARR